MTLSHPFGPPVVSGNDITVDQMLNEVTRVEAYILDITMDEFWITDVFDNTGGVSGGAVLHDQITETNTFPTRRAEEVASGAEIPNLTPDREEMKIAPVRQISGKSWIHRNAVKRNQLSSYQKGLQRIANELTRTTNDYGVLELLKVIDSENTITGEDWSAATSQGSNPTPFADTPIMDFAKIQQLTKELRMGLKHDLLLVSPQNHSELIGYFGSGSKMRDTAREFGIEDIRSSIEVTTGQPLAVARGQVGEMRQEEPMLTETWYEYETQRWWTQSSVFPVAFVTNKFGVIRINGV